jgi:hypothetical protein
LHTLLPLLPRLEIGGGGGKKKETSHYLGFTPPVDTSASEAPPTADLDADERENEIRRKRGKEVMRCGRWRKKRMKREIKTRKRKNELSKFLEIVIHNLHWLYYY